MVAATVNICAPVWPRTSMGAVKSMSSTCLKISTATRKRAFFLGRHRKSGRAIVDVRVSSGAARWAGVNRDDLRSLRDLSGSKVACQLLSLYREAIRSGDGLDFEARSLETISDIVRLLRSVPRDLPALHRTRDYLHAHFHQKVTMRDLAALS